MIDRTILTRVSRIKGISNMDFASKDYFQEIVLLSISREFPHLVFKGGTCLYKFHGLDRFSEDLDLVGKTQTSDLKKISEYLSDFGYPSELKTYSMNTGVLSTFVIRGFLYDGEDVSLTRVRMDVTEKDEVIRPPTILTMRSFYPDIPSFSISTMDPVEIFAEKFRSLFQRSRSRDLYDLVFLRQKNTKIDPDLIGKKMGSYGIKIDREDLSASLKMIEKNWTVELKPIIGRIPSFKDYEIMALKIFDEVAIPI